MVALLKNTGTGGAYASLIRHAMHHESGTPEVAPACGASLLSSGDATGYARQPNVVSPAPHPSQNIALFQNRNRCGFAADPKTAIIAVLKSAALSRPFGVLA